MADFPVSGDIADALSKILSNIIPPKTYTYLAAFLPGLFFEISVLLANPLAVHQLTAQPKEIFHLGRTVELAVALFLAFVIGNVFMLMVGVIRRVLEVTYRLRGFIWRQLCGGLLRPISQRALQSERWNKRRWVHTCNQYVQMKEFGFPDDSEGARKCWAIFARQLLQRRYGIEAQHLGQEEWNALYWSLGTLTADDVRERMLMVTTEATGLCGLTAVWFAPALQEKYYLGFAAFMVAIGLVHDWFVIKGTNDEKFLGLLKIRSLLREFRDIPQPKRSQGGENEALPGEADI